MTEQKIVGRSGPTPNLIPWSPDETTLPMKHVKTGHRVGGAFALLVGIPWTYYSARYLLEELRHTGLDSGQFFLLLLVMGGVFFVLFGLSQFIYREETVIYPGMVSWRRHGLSGFRAWQEPLSAYRGVFKKYLDRDSADSHGPSYRTYSIILSHEERSKWVVLYEVNDPSMSPPPEWEQKWRYYAGMFQLPLLEETGEGVIMSTPEDLGLPLLEKIAVGKIQVPPYDSSETRLGAGISLGREDDLWVITLRPFIRLWKGLVFFLLCGILLGLSLHFRLIPPQLILYFVLPVIFLFLIFGVSIWRKLKHPEQLAVDKEVIWDRSWNKRLGWKTRSIAITDILNISLKKDPSGSRRGDQIVIEGRSDTLRFGEWLPSRTKRKLKALILSLVGSEGD
ncbi:MAG: hypothetical protein ABIG67_02570 [Pseudomonadota bacterium]